MPSKKYHYGQDRFTVLVHVMGLCWVDAIDVITIELLCGEGR